MNLLELSTKKELFNFDEFSFLKKKLSKKNWKISYAIFKQKSFNNTYVTFIIDYFPSSGRRSAAQNSWLIISQRSPNKLEFEELINNYGTQHRRFKVWYYSNIEQLMQDDLKYGIHTPKDFIDKCKQLGYTGDTQLQLKI